MAKEEGAASPSQVAEFLLDRTGVLVAPGRVFGEGFDDFVRFAAVVSEERIREVVSSLTSLAHANSL
jgi:aspartate/methionine/tyrosine aminotransferase